LVQLLQLAIAGAIGLAVFALIASQMRLPEVDQLVTRLRQRFGRSS
jgi:putative peptidoglycan lipid II flippase